MKKACRLCYIYYPLNNFHKKSNSKDGHNSICKQCKGAVEAERYLIKRTQITFNRREKYCENPDKFKAANKKWKEKNPDNFIKSLRKYRSTNRLKENARRSVLKRVIRNKITKSPCLICKNPKVEAHHTDYTKPFDVMWLCKSHHTAWHRVFLTE